MAAIWLLFALWTSADENRKLLPLLGLFNGPPGATGDAMRSRYEEQIRQAARQGGTQPSGARPCTTP